MSKHSTENQHLGRRLAARKVRKAIAARVRKGALHRHNAEISELTRMYDRLSAIVNPTRERTSS